MQERASPAGRDDNNNNNKKSDDDDSNNNNNDNDNDTNTTTITTTTNNNDNNNNNNTNNHVKQIMLASPQEQSNKLRPRKGRGQERGAGNDRNYWNYCFFFVFFTHNNSY